MPPINPKKLEEIYFKMCLIRSFEEACIPLLESKEVLCPVHLYIGEEGIASGVCAALTDKDAAFSTHRSHGHYLAKGGDVNALMAEILCREDGCSRGRGGSMHVTDASKGFIASSAIVCGTIPLAVGAGLSSKFKKDGSVSVAFFGDGAMDEGVFFEVLNMAALYKLPVVFVCENNLFSTHLPLFKRQANQKLSEKVASFGVRTKQVFGNDAEEVFSNASELLPAVRNGEGPLFLECMTYRWYAHVGPERDMDIGFRKKEEVLSWVAKCPITLMESRYTELKLAEIKERAVQAVKDALAFARKSSFPDPSEISAHF